MKSRRSGRSAVGRRAADAVQWWHSSVKLATRCRTSRMKRRRSVIAFTSSQGIGTSSLPSLAKVSAMYLDYSA
jgi:hypothetical protein